MGVRVQGDWAENIKDAGLPDENKNNNEIRIFVGGGGGWLFFKNSSTHIDAICKMGQE